MFSVDLARPLFYNLLEERYPPVRTVFKKLELYQTNVILNKHHTRIYKSSQKICSILVFHAKRYLMYSSHVDIVTLQHYLSIAKSSPKIL